MIKQPYINLGNAHECTHSPTGMKNTWAIPTLSGATKTQTEPNNLNTNNFFRGTSLIQKAFRIECLLALLLCFCTLSANTDITADSLEILPADQADSLKAEELNRLAGIHLLKKQPQRSLKKSLRALDIASQNKSGILYLKTIVNLMEAYAALFLYEDALKLSKEIEIASSKLKNNDIKIRNYIKTAAIYRNIRDFQTAEKFYRLGLIALQVKPIVKRSNNLKTEILLGLAVCLRNQNKFKEAMRLNRTGLELAKDASNDSLLSFFYNNIGDLYEIEGLRDSAYLCYQTSMQYNLKNNDTEGLYFNYSNLASIEKFRGNYDKAIELLKESVALAEKNNNFNFLYINYLHLYGAYSAKRDHQTALEYLILLEQTSIPESDTDTSLYVAKVESKFELDKKEREKEIINLKMAQEKTRYLLIIMTILILLLLASAVYYFKYKQKKIDELTLKEGKARAELDALQARINPHFLFNSLNSLGTLITRDTKNADLMLNSLSRLLRYTLQTAKKNQVTLEEEMSTVKNYLLIEKIRFEDRLDFSINCTEQLQNYLIPPLIIQPLVENSIKYAIGRMTKDGKIEISCSLAQQKLIIKVKDNGPALDKQLPASKSTGFGMKYIKERLQFMYGSNYSFEVDKTDGYTVTITMPAETVKN